MFQEVTSNIVLAENIYGSNLTCIALDNKLVFVDAGLNTEFAIYFRKSMETKYGLKARTLMITHAHMDHILGMGAFSDCEIIAASQGVQRFNRFLETKYSEEVIQGFERVFPYFRESLENSQLRKPDKWVKDKLDCSGELIFEVEGGHTSCSSSVYIRKAGVLVTGDLIQVDVYPYFGEPDTNIKSWVNTLRKWEKMPIKALVPGHGRIVNINYLAKVSDFFEEMLNKMRILKQKGVPVHEVLHQADLHRGYWPENAVRKPAYDRSVTNLYNSIN
jgi:glyoxylase-like metal-dependent hydrolase (beta-lactamase superfamily II)